MGAFSTSYVCQKGNVCSVRKELVCKLAPASRRVTDPHHVYANPDPDPAYHLDPDTDPACSFDTVTDPDPTIHFDLDQDSSK
jgi:hypothetical protein